MKKKIAIRTAISPETGIGHYMRMHRLAKELQLRGTEVFFILDAGTNLQNLPEDVPAFFLPHAFTTTANDAAITLQIIQKKNVSLVIADDYRLDSHWERILMEAGCKVVAFDDICRPHVCTAVIDIRWYGSDSPYSNLLAENTLLLSGPAYALLEPDIRPSSTPIQTDEAAVITLSIGGGGDLSILTELTKTLLKNKELFQSKLKIQIVEGPQAFNRNILADCATQNPEVTLVRGKTSLTDTFALTHLFIGAATGSLYELLAMQIPAITFSIAQNQQSDPAILRDIGHHFHIPDFTSSDYEAVSRLAARLMSSWPRVSQLYKNPRIPIDGRGCMRTADAIEAILKEKQPDIKAIIPTPKATPPSMSIGNNCTIRPVCDGDMGHYLESRNLPANCQNMVIQKPIREIDHYLWWFTTARSSFLYEKNQQALLYIWHEIIQQEQRPYLIGGWFVCSGECSFADAIAALAWQLEYCEKEAPGVPWIAVISKKNHFVRKLNQYMKFRDINENETLLIKAIKTCFPEACTENFYFVTRP